MMASTGNAETMSATTDRGSALSRARRHSRIVRTLRLGLPVLALALVAGAVISYTGIATSYGPVSIERISMEDGALKIEKPRLSGVTGDDRAYQVSAVSARQDANRPNMVRLEGVRAELEEDGGGMTTLTADNGEFNANREWLDLDSDITVTWPAGHQMRLSRMRVDMKKGTIVSRAPVAIDMLNGTLNAQAMRVSRRGEVVRFTGGVTLQFRPKAKDAQ